MHHTNFCLLTFDSSSKEPSLHIERIDQNESFRDTCVVSFSLLPCIRTLVYKAGCVIIKGHLPVVDLKLHQIWIAIQLIEMKFCFCNGPDEGSICCDNDTCKMMWFHLKCLKIRNLYQKANGTVPIVERTIKESQAKKS